MKNFAFKKLGIDRKKIDDSIWDELGLTNHLQGETKDIAINGFKDLTNYIDSYQFLFLDDWEVLIPIAYEVYKNMFYKLKNNVNSEDFMEYLINEYKQYYNNIDKNKFIKLVTENTINEFRYLI